MSRTVQEKKLRAENAHLRLRLEEAEQALEAIRTGQVESLVVEGGDGLVRIFSIEGATHSYRVLVEAMNEGAATINEAGLILYCNAQFARMLDVPLERVMGHSFDKWLPLRSRPAIEALLQEPEGGDIRTEMTLLGANGQEVPVYLSMRAISDEGQRLWCMLATDLREQKRNEKIVASERLARSMLEQAGEGILICDARGVVIRANAAATKLCGESPVRRPFRELFCIELQGEAAPTDVVAKALAGQQYRSHPGQLHRRDGSVRDLLMSAAALRFSKEKSRGCVVNLVDVTELKTAIKVRDEFLSIASHELRTPLTALDLELETLLKIIRREEGDGGASRMVRKVQTAIRQSDRLTALIDDLLSVSRIAMGRFHLELDDFDLGDVVEEVLERLGAAAQQSGCQFNFRHQGLLQGRWDRLRIDQVLTNLLTNALKYGAGKPIDVSVSSIPTHVMLVVRDRGIGIAEADVGRIFDRFERAVSSRHFGGLGLGLYITRQIVEAHRGIITVESVPGDGATFSVTLPRIAEASRSFGLTEAAAERTDS